MANPETSMSMIFILDFHEIWTQPLYFKKLFCIYLDGNFWWEMVMVSHGKGHEAEKKWQSAKNLFVSYAYFFSILFKDMLGRIINSQEVDHTAQAIHWRVSSNLYQDRCQDPLKKNISIDVIRENRLNGPRALVIDGQLTLKMKMNLKIGMRNDGSSDTNSDRAETVILMMSIAQNLQNIQTRGGVLSTPYLTMNITRVLVDMNAGFRW